MTTKGRKLNLNVALKMAILASGQTQRKFATKIRIGEVRLSAIIRGHGPEATPEEKTSIAIALKRSVDELFPEQKKAVA